MGGNVLWAMQATSRQAYIDLYLNDQQRDPIRFQEGLFIRGVPFSRVFVTHAAQAGQTITLFYAVEEIDNIQVENPALQFTMIDLTKATVFDSLADIIIVAAAVAVIVVPALATQRTAIIASLAVNGQTCRIGDATTGAARGIELAPGESISISTTEAIYAYNPAGANITLSRVWTAD